MSKKEMSDNKQSPFVSEKELVELGFTPGDHFSWLQKLSNKYRDEGWTKEDVLADFATAPAGVKEGLALAAQDKHIIGTCKDCKHWNKYTIMWSSDNLEHRSCDEIDKYVSPVDQRYGSVPREDFGCVHWKGK